MRRLCRNCHTIVHNGSDRHWGLDKNGKAIPHKSNGCPLVGKRGDHGNKRPLNASEVKIMEGVPEALAALAGIQPVYHKTNNIRGSDRQRRMDFDDAFPGRRAAHGSDTGFSRW